MRTPQQRVIARKQAAARARDYARELRQDAAREQAQAKAARAQAKAERVRQLSTVMTLGNRLASRMGGDRKAVFVKAWQIVKAGGLELAVRGVSFGNRQEALRRLAAYAPDRVQAFIVPEPENPVDPAALAVMVGVQGGKGLYRLGYVPRTMVPAAAALGGRMAAVRVVSGSWGRAHKTTYGARIALAV
jgi:hypothetical protein